VGRGKCATSGKELKRRVLLLVRNQPMPSRERGALKKYQTTLARAGRRALPARSARNKKEVQIREAGGLRSIAVPCSWPEWGGGLRFPGLWL